MPAGTPEASGIVVVATSGMSDEHFIRHLEKRHEADVLMVWLPLPGREDQPRTMNERNSWELYHRRLHDQERVEDGHQHE